MNQNSLRIVVFLVAVCAPSLLATAQPPSALGPEEGVLLLRNGQVIRGKISAAGDRFLVTMPGGEGYIRTADVEFHCRTVEQGYAHKRSVLDLSSVNGHLDLAQWAMQQGLMNSAADEIRDALALEPQHPRIELMIRKLELAIKQAPPPRATPETEAEPGPSNEDLDRLARAMPAGAMEAFTTSIQPLLLNNCTAAGCHGPASESKYHWQRVSTSRQSNRRLTQRNLHTTMQLIDRARPEHSPLLASALTAHGSAKTPVFVDVNSLPYRQLLAWVTQVSRSKEPLQPATVEGVGGTSSQTMPLGNSAAVAPSTPVTPANFTTDLPKDGDSTDAPPAVPQEIKHGAGKAPQRNEPNRGSPAPGGFTPKDPFDPEIFNRQK